MVQAGSFDFLAQSRFDFNKWFYDSQGYLSFHDHDKLLEKISSFQSGSNSNNTNNGNYLNNQNGSNGSNINNSPNSTGILDQVWFDPPEIRRFVQQFNEEQLQITLQLTKSQTPIKQSKEEIDRIIEIHNYIQGNLNNFNASRLTQFKNKQAWTDLDTLHRQLYEQDINTLFNDHSHITSQMQKAQGSFTNQQIVDFLASKAVDTNFMEQQEDLLGFSRIIKLLGDLQKPIISHNGPLPENVDDFKAKLNGLLPQIFDTKHMINSRQYLQLKFPESSLSTVYQSICNPEQGWEFFSFIYYELFLFVKLQILNFEYDQKIKLNENFKGYSLTGDVYHDAGFDALMTGILFCKFMTKLNFQSDKNDFPKITQILENDEHLTMDKNKLPLASIRHSLKLTPEPLKQQKPQNQEQNTSENSENPNQEPIAKPYEKTRASANTEILTKQTKRSLYVLENIPQFLQTDDLTNFLRNLLVGAEFKIYKAFNKNLLYLSYYSVGDDKFCKFQDALRKLNMKEEDQLNFNSKVNYVSEIIGGEKVENSGTGPSDIQAAQQEIIIDTSQPIEEAFIDYEYKKFVTHPDSNSFNLLQQKVNLKLINNQLFLEPQQQQTR